MQFDTACQNKPAKVVLKDQMDAVFIDRDMNYNEVAARLGEP